MRILVANDPRSYREVMAAAFQAMRPHVEVSVIDPCDLDCAVVSHNPHIVVCSCLTETVETRPLAWVVLYPGGKAGSIISVAGQRSTVADMELDGLLAIIDDMELRTRTN